MAKIFSRIFLSTTQFYKEIVFISCISYFLSNVGAELLGDVTLLVERASAVGLTAATTKKRLNNS